MQSCRSYPATTFTRSAADPLNLVGMVTLGDRRAVGNRIVYRNGIPLAARGHAPRARRQRSGKPRPGPPRRPRHSPAALQQGDESRSFIGYVGPVG
jgi:hypothetical protein